MKLTRSQIIQLECLRDFEATTRAKAVLLAESQSLSPQSLHSMVGRGLVIRTQIFKGPPRGWLTAYCLSPAGKKFLRDRQNKARRDLKMLSLKLLKRDLVWFLKATRAVRNDEAIRRFVRHNGGEISFSSGAYRLRLGTVSATATSGVLQAAEAWLRHADRQIKMLRSAA